jgi:hypothetical protein
MTVDLFGDPTLVGLKMKLDRPADRKQPCCRNICMIGAGRGPHAGALHCVDCGRHRGWISKVSADWLKNVIARFGAIESPIVVCKQEPNAASPRGLH